MPMAALFTRAKKMEATQVSMDGWRAKQNVLLGVPMWLRGNEPDQ